MNAPTNPRPNRGSDDHAGIANVPEVDRVDSAFDDPVDAVLAMLLVADLEPDGDGDSGVDALIEPPAAKEPIMSLERRRRLLSVVGDELAIRRRDVGYLPQVLFRYRDAASEGPEELAHRANELLETAELDDLLGSLPQAPSGAPSIAGGRHLVAVDAETVRQLETDSADLDDGRNQAIAAVLCAMHGIRPEAAREALLWSLEPPVDGPLAAARPKLKEASPDDKAQIHRFMTIYERVRRVMDNGPS